MHPSLFSLPPAVTHFAARAGDHNNHAMAATPVLAMALTQRMGLMPDALHVVGKPDRKSVV